MSIFIKQQTIEISKTTYFNIQPSAQRWYKLMMNLLLQLV